MSLHVSILDLIQNKLNILTAAVPVAGERVKSSQIERATSQHNKYNADGHIFSLPSA